MTSSRFGLERGGTASGTVAARALPIYGSFVGRDRRTQHISSYRLYFRNPRFRLTFRLTIPED
jgi:hypothetical protein